jgi:hypothetical protein
MVTLQQHTASGATHAIQPALWPLPFRTVLTGIRDCALLLGFAGAFRRLQCRLKWGAILCRYSILVAVGLFEIALGEVPESVRRLAIQGTTGLD